MSRWVRTIRQPPSSLPRPILKRTRAIRQYSAQPLPSTCAARTLPPAAPPQPQVPTLFPRWQAMSLRQLRRRSAALLRDGGLLQALRGELNHELSSSTPQSQGHQVGSSFMGFTLEWDDPRAQDVVLRRHGDAEGEELAVSAMLGPLRFDGEQALPRNARMKVCIKKTGLEPVLHFDCSIFRRQDDEELVDGFGYGCSDFAVKGVYYHPAVDSLGVYKYRGPRFSSLDPQLQKALKECLVARGVGIELTRFLIEHLHRKEHGQYVNWLRTLEGTFAKDA